MAELEKHPSYKFEFRTFFKGKEEYYRIKFAYMPDNHDVVIMGLLNIDEQVRREMEHAAMKEKAEKEEVLRQALEQERQFRNVLVDSTDGFLKANLSRNEIEGVITDISKTGERIEMEPMDIYGSTGYDEFEKWWAENKLLSDPEEFLAKSNCAYLISSFEAGEPEVEVICTSEDEKGSPKTCRQDYYMYRDDITGDVRAFCIVWDITAEVENRKRIEKEMQVINGLASDFLSLYTINLDENSVNIYSISDKIADVRNIVSGYSNFTDGFRQYTESNIHEDDRDKVYWLTDVENIHKVLDNTRSHKVFVRTNDIGEWKWVEANVIKCEPVSEPARNLILAFTDRDEQVVHELEARKQLMESKEQLQRSLSMSNYFISSFVSAYYVDLNDASCTVLKRTSELEDAYPVIDNYVTVVNDYIAHDVHEDDREMLYELVKPENIKARLAGEGAYSALFRDIMGGTEKNYRFQIFRGADDDHAAFCIMDVTADIKKEKEAKEALEQALAMAQSANRAKTTFLNNMSHDIRTPMNAIIGFTNMAIKHKDDQEKLTDYLVKTQLAGNLLLSLVNSILDMSRIESGRARLEEDKGDVYLSFANIESTMQELANTKNISLDFKVENVKDRYVYCDFSRCQRIFINLISNAIKYTHDGGWVKVRGTQVGKAENGYGLYRYTVEDNGIGMSEEFQKHVFEEFTRENNSTISGIQGTGLGLAVCKSFITLMSGTIECESKQGVGSKFTVTVPFRLQSGKEFRDPKQDLISMEDAEETRALLEGRITLLVEDNEMNREIARDILEEEGLVVEEAVDGKDAVKKIRDKGPDYYDFVLMDIQMPVMNGYEATREIREMYPNKKVPIIAVSANAFEEDRKASLEAGMNAHIAKPIVIRELFDTIKKFIH